MAQDDIQIIKDTEPHRGTWNKIIIAQPAVFARLMTTEGEKISGAASFEAGSEICGDFIGIQLVSGTIVAFIEPE